MTKLRILIFAIATIFALSFIAGCSSSANANTGTELPSNANNETVAAKKTGIVSLTNEELTHFNGNDFFNGEYMNIRNQFLSSLYSSPEKIDLFELFYCGNGLEANPSTEKEVSAVLAYLGWDSADCSLEKNNRTNMDAILTQYMGLTLADTDGVGLENMTYLSEYDAYYYFRGDTNYRMSVAFTAGEREGDIIRLFYDDTFMGGSKVLTLRETDSRYLFVSNRAIKSSAIEIPVYLPLPVYEAFVDITTEQDSLDAFLHYTTLSAFSAHYASLPIDLRIPSLRLIETWEAEDGDTYYLCWSAQMYYPRLAESIRFGEPYADSYNDLNIRLIRFKIKDTSDWGFLEFKYPQYQCVEILYTPDGETNFTPDKFECFPGSPERISRIISGDQDDYIRDILPSGIAHDYYALLESYLEYYGFDIPTARSN